MRDKQHDSSASLAAALWSWDVCLFSSILVSVCNGIAHVLPRVSDQLRRPRDLPSPSWYATRVRPAFTTPPTSSYIIKLWPATTECQPSPEARRDLRKGDTAGVTAGVEDKEAEEPKPAPNVLPDASSSAAFASSSAAFLSACLSCSPCSSLLSSYCAIASSRPSTQRWRSRVVAALSANVLGLFLSRKRETYTSNRSLDSTRTWTRVEISMVPRTLPPFFFEYLTLPTPSRHSSTK
mmetsp:Transcript_21002/g.23386  ORF Transcript_21002/g.23386 Transcript_21002/m.23386 type:complete len:237 (+) Transcript_21002:797-1507(+)